MRRAIMVGIFVGLQACGGVDTTAVRMDTGGTGGAVGTGGVAGMTPGTGGEGLAMATGGAAGTIIAQTGGAPGTGGLGGMGNSVGTGGAQATGGAVGTGGTTISGCSFPGASWTKDGMYRGVTTGGACRMCASDPECATAYGAGNQCQGGSCALVGPWGPMPRQTCNIFSAQFADGQATTTSAVAVNQSDNSCVMQAKSFLGNRPSLALCMGVPVNYTGTVLSTTTSNANGWSDDDGNCDATIIVQISGANGCQFDATFNLLAQAPPKGAGPFPPPSCN